MAQIATPFTIDLDATLNEAAANMDAAALEWKEALVVAHCRTVAKFPIKSMVTRIHSAMTIIEGNGVRFDEIGRIWVGSQTRDKYYLINDKPCRCEDVVHEGAPNGYCKHKVAGYIFALANQIIEEKGVETADPLFNTPEPDDVPEAEVPEAPAPEAPRATAQGEYYTLADPPCKATIKWRDEDGVEVWVTIGDFDDRSLCERIKKYREFSRPQVDRANVAGVLQFGSPYTKGASTGGNRSGSGSWCGRHQKKFFRNNDGSWSHKLDDGSFCKATAEQAAKFSG